MAAATKNRPITGPKTGGFDLPKRFDIAVAASTRIFGGTMVARDFATTGRPACPAVGNNLNKIVHGFAEKEFDNTSGAQGDKTAGIVVTPGWVINSAAADQITDADLFQLAYVVDDQTVARTSNSGARPVAGLILDVDSALGVLIMPGAELARPNIGYSGLRLFISTEQTGTGSAQNIAHGLGIVPTKVFVAPTDLSPATVGQYTVAEGAHDGTNVVVTVTTGKKYKVLAIA
jgi:hypothetical protein